MRQKAVVAMSGGVDSSVAAALLVEQGYDVTGIMLKLWRGGAENLDSGCCNVGAAEDARRVADRLDIPFYVFDLAERFEDTVIADFKSTYARGQTPNPCVRCNQWIKFDALLDRAEALGTDVLATGHYAQVVERDGHFGLRRGVDPTKDQSYVLWMLSQHQLAKVRFPVGGMQKTETRKIAEELGLRTAAKPDSQEICFVRSGEVGDFVAASAPAAGEAGAIVDSGGKTLGEHRGISNYTVGQRKGLGISLGVPVYVTGVDASTNTLVVGSRDDLLVRELSLQEMGFVSEAPSGPVLVQHRAHGDAAPATFSPDGDEPTLRFDEPVEAVAPGQSVALYSSHDPEELLGGGIIAATRAATAVA